MFPGDSVTMVVFCFLMFTSQVVSVTVVVVPGVPLVSQQDGNRYGVDEGSLDFWTGGWTGW